MNAAPDRKPLMRSLGEFFGHILKGVRTDPRSGTTRATGATEVRREVSEERRGKTVLRRTTIEEIELHDDD